MTKKSHARISDDAERKLTGPLMIDMPWEEAVKIAVRAGRFPKALGVGSPRRELPQPTCDVPSAAQSDVPSSDE